METMGIAFKKYLQHTLKDSAKAHEKVFQQNEEKTLCLSNPMRSQSLCHSGVRLFAKGCLFIELGKENPNRSISNKELHVLLSSESTPALALITHLCTSRTVSSHTDSGETTRSPAPAILQLLMSVQRCASVCSGDSFAKLSNLQLGARCEGVQKISKSLSYLAGGVNRSGSLLLQL